MMNTVQQMSSFEFQMVCVVRLLLASVCGFAIGIERTNRLKDAGMRTHLIVCMGAGMYLIAVAGTIILITAQSLLHNEHIIGGGLMFLVLRIDGRNGTVSQTVQQIQALGGELVDLTVTQKKNDIIRVEMRIKPGKNVDQLTIIGELEKLPWVLEVNE